MSGSKSSHVARNRATKRIDAADGSPADNRAGLSERADTDWGRAWLAKQDELSRDIFGRTEDEQDQAAIDVLRAAFRRIERDGWAPLEAVLFRERNTFERRRLAGNRISLLVAVRQTEPPRGMVDQARALEALQRLCGMFLPQWETLPMVTQENVLELVSKAIVSLGGKRPELASRRGGWRVA